MHSLHDGLTVAAEINNDISNEDIKIFFDKWKIRADAAFDSCESVIFASVTLLPKQKSLPQTLMFFTSFSGSRKHHIEELINKGGRELIELLQFCRIFSKQASEEDLRQFIKKNRNANYFYSGMNGLTLQNVIKDNELRAEVEKFVFEDRKQLVHNSDERMIYRKIKNHIQLLDNFKWVFTPDKRNTLAYFFTKLRLAFIGLLMAAILFAPFFLFNHSGFQWAGVILILVVIIGLIVLVVLAEKQPDQPAERPDLKHVINVSATQKDRVMNEMTSAGPLKNGLARRILYFFILHLAPLAIPIIPPIPTIATARWTSANRGRRLVFISNYSNTTEFYVRDFIDVKSSAIGINFLFGHGSGFPATKFLITKGCLQNPQAFMNVVIGNQHITQYWYAPLQHLTVDNIIRNKKLREGLYKEPVKDKLRDWLLLI